jgi:hypothetical protein
VNPFPSDRILQHMGFFSDQDGIVRRFINEGSNWNEHLKNTKSFIELCVKDACPKNIAVLGSGWMLDVPLDFLAEHCDNVFLFDIRHPRQVVHRFRNLKNISFINQDITGGAIEFVYKTMDKRRPKPEELNHFIPDGFSSKVSIDYVVSVNILNQLDILLLEYLRKFSLPDSFSAEKFRSNIQLAHINSLLKNKLCLITDYEELLYDNADQLLKTNSLLYTHIPEGKMREEWIWKFDSQMTYYPNQKTYFKVQAIQF